MQDADIIEISSQTTSSPPLEPIKTRTRQATRSANGNAKGKGKMKDVEVIELTDGDDDLEGTIRTAHWKPVASPSARKRRKVIVVDTDSDSDSGAAPKAGPSRVRGVSRPSSSKLHASNGIRRAGSRSNIPHENRAAVLGAGPETGDSEVSHAVNGKGKARDDGGAATGGHGVDMGKSDEENRPPPQPQRPSAVPGPSRIGPSPHGLLSPSRSVAIVGGPLSPDPSPAASSLLPVPQPMSQQRPIPPPPLEETPDQLQSRFTAQILEIIPDVDPAHVSSLVTDHFPQLKDATIERVLHILFEDPTYPRAQKDVKGKRKATDGEGERQKKRARKEKEKEKAKENELWLNTERPFVGGKDYHDLALNQLQTDYSRIPKAYLLSQLTTRYKGFYAPTFFSLRQLERQLEDIDGAGLVTLDGVVYNKPPYEPLKTPHKPSDPRRKGKGKQKALEDREFDRELKWVQRMVAIEEGQEVEDDGNEGIAEEADDKNDDEAKVETDEEGEEVEESDGEDEEKGIECGCCFSKFRFEKLVQCPDAHLFCRSCIRAYAATQLGSHNPHIPCMAQSTCNQTFLPSVLRTALPRKLYALYERLVQAKEIAAAGLDNLEECPFCEYKAVFDVGFEEEKLFRCGGCGSVSCRKCKRVDHLPKRCEEVEEDKKLDARHLVEEAMTQALMRNCPKCKKAFIKESGCNKMACPNCRTLSCYICRKVISGYDHFNQNPGRAGTSSDAGKCVLWDKDLDAMHASEVKKAADKAIAEAQLLHPDVLVSDLKVDAPKTRKSKKAQQQQQHPPVHLGARMPMAPPPPAHHRQHRGRGRAPVQRLPEMDFNFRFNLNLGDAAQGPAPPQGIHFVHDLRHLRQPPPQPLPPPLHQAQHRRAPVVQRGAQRPVLYEQQQPPQIQQYQRPVIGRGHAQMQQRGMPQGPPLPPQPPLPPPPYHEAVAQAMRGDYQPVGGGGVEVGGMRLRARPGRGAVPGAGAVAVGGGAVAGAAYPEYRREAIGNVYGDVGRMMLEGEREREREVEIRRERERQRLQRQMQVQGDPWGLWLGRQPLPQQQQHQPRVEVQQDFGVGMRALMVQRLAQADAQVAARAQHNQEQVGRKRKARHAT